MIVKKRKFAPRKTDNVVMMITAIGPLKSTKPGTEKWNQNPGVLPLIGVVKSQKDVANEDITPDPVYVELWRRDDFDIDTLARTIRVCKCPQVV
jgi:hypothetical protein